jgi:hypothetical protein
MLVLTYPISADVSRLSSDSGTSGTRSGRRVIESPTVILRAVNCMQQGSAGMEMRITAVFVHLFSLLGLAEFDEFAVPLDELAFETLNGVVWGVVTFGS